MEDKDWKNKNKNKPMLVWKGKIIEKLDTDCEYGDFICELECHDVKVKPFRLRVCGQLFVDIGNKVGDDISIPMGFQDENGKIYHTGTDNTPVSSPVKDC